MGGIAFSYAKQRGWLERRCTGEDSNERKLRERESERKRHAEI